MRCSAVLVICAATLALAAPARGVMLTPSGPDVATSGSSTAVAWLRSDGYSTARQILLVVRGADGTFSTPELVADEPQAGLTRLTSQGFGPSIAGPVRAFVTAAGDVLVVWQRAVGAPDRMVLSRQTWARWRRADGTWTPATAVTGPLDFSATVEVAVAASGRAYVAYARDASSQTLLSTATPGQPFSAPSIVPGIVFGPTLAVTPGGDALLVGQGSDRAARLALVRRTPDGTYRPPVTLLATSSDVNLGVVRDRPLVTSGPDGSAVVAWLQSDRLAMSTRLAIVAPGADHPAEQALSAASQAASLLALGQRADGQATLIVAQSPHAFALTGRPGQPFTSEDLSAASVPDAVIDDNRALALLGVYPNTATPAYLTGRLRTAAGPFEPLPRVTEEGHTFSSPSAALSTAGAVITWADGGGAGDATIQVADAAAGTISRTRLDAALDVPRRPVPVLLQVSSAARLTRSGRLALTVRCRSTALCSSTVRVVRGTSARGPTLANKTLRVGPGRKRVLALAIGPRTIRSIRAKQLTRALAVVQGSAGPVTWRVNVTLRIAAT